MCNHFWNSYYINKFSLAFLWFLKVYASNSKRYFFSPLYLWNCQSDKSFRGLRPSRVLLSSRILYIGWTAPCLASWLNFFSFLRAFEGLYFSRIYPDTLSYPCVSSYASSHYLTQAPLTAELFLVRTHKKWTLVQNSNQLLEAKGYQVFSFPLVTMHFRINKKYLSSVFKIPVMASHSKRFRFNKL